MERARHAFRRAIVARSARLDGAGHVRRRVAAQRRCLRRAGLVSYAIVPTSPVDDRRNRPCAAVRRRAAAHRRAAKLLTLKCSQCPPHVDFSTPHTSRGTPSFRSHPNASSDARGCSWYLSPPGGKASRAGPGSSAPGAAPAGCRGQGLRARYNRVACAATRYDGRAQIDRAPKLYPLPDFRTDIRPEGESPAPVE